MPLITRAKFAALIGVSPQAITKAIKAGHIPVSSDRIDTENDQVVAYANYHRHRKRGDEPFDASRLPPVDADEINLEALDGLLEEIGRSGRGDEVERLSRLPYAKILEIFGNTKNHLDWLDSKRKEKDVIAKTLSIEEQRGALISRELVDARVFQFLDGIMRRLLSDGAKTIAVQAHGLCESGATIEELEALVRKQIGSQIEPARDGVVRVLRKHRVGSSGNAEANGGKLPA